MRSWVPTGVLVAIGVLAACGSKNTGGEVANPAESPPPSGNASAEQVAKEARGKVKCPAKIASPARAAGAPVDDVVGVRPGMTYDEAVNVVLCSHDMLVTEQDDTRAVTIETFGEKLRYGFSARFAQPRVQKTGEQIVAEMQDRAMARGTNRLVQDMKAGEAKWYVSTIGLRGKEQVLSAAREEWFEEGRFPTATSVRDALVAKYGEPTDHASQQSGANTQVYVMNWPRDARQQPVRDQQCQLSPDPDAGANYSTSCGITVAAALYLRRDNPELVEYLQVGVIDNAGGYAAILATEEALRQLDAGRRAEQVQQAEKNSDAPTL